MYFSDDDCTALKPMIKKLIKYYYSIDGNGTGGYCHIVLDDGNLTEHDISYCQELCSVHDDHLGYLIMTFLRYFTEEEREQMYDKDWGMNDA